MRSTKQSGCLLLAQAVKRGKGRSGVFLGPLLWGLALAAVPEHHSDHERLWGTKNRSLTAA